jgi:hypothetical protein
MSAMRCAELHFGDEQSAGGPKMAWLRGNRVVLVDGAAQDVATIDVERRGNAGHSAVGHGHTEIDATMWTLSVVVSDVPPKHSLQMPASEDEHVAETFVAHGSHPAFCVGIGPGRSDRRLDHPDALGAQHLVEAGRELGVPIPDQELDGSTAIHQITDQVASHLGDERTGRMVGDPEDVHLPSRQFDDEEHVELFERHGVHGKEVRSQHTVRLGGQELGPRGSTPWGRPQARSAQDPSDRTGRDADTELSKLTLDANTPPASVLPTQANDEPDQFIAHRRSAISTLLPPTAPLVLGRFPVPSQQRVGGNQEGPPPSSRKQSAECSENRSIGWLIPDTCVQLAFENTHLVPEHHDLDVLVRLTLPARQDEAEDPAQADVEE